jgi:hypothetical protein
MKVLSAAPPGCVLDVPDAMMRHGLGPHVICVTAPPACILTAAAQLVQLDTLLVACCRQLPFPGGVLVSSRPSRRQRAPARVVAVSAHCLRTVERCNELLAHCGRDTLLILLIAAGARLSTHFRVDASYEITMRNPTEPPVQVPPAAVYRREKVPARRVRLCVVAKTEDIGNEPLPQYAGEESTELKLADGTDAVLWVGMLVRAGVSRVLQREAGVSPGLIGVIEQLSANNFPIVRFANMAVVLVTGESVPLTPCNRMVTTRDLQELPMLPPGWELERMDGVNWLPIQHL